MPYLLDTNTCIQLMQNSPNVVAQLQSRSPSECSISTISTYELFTGVAKCADPARERAKVARLFNVIGQLPFDHRAAEQAGLIRAILEQSGQMIGPYDILIAAQAVAHRLELVTSNEREFQRVVGLTVHNWNS